MFHFAKNDDLSSKNDPGQSTVCFFSFEILYDDVTQKVVEIIDFCIKFLGGMVDAFCDM